MLKVISVVEHIGAWNHMMVLCKVECSSCGHTFNVPLVISGKAAASAMCLNCMVTHTITKDMFKHEPIP